MEEQAQNTSLDQTIKNSEVPTAVIAKDLPYIPIEEMFNTPEYDAYIDTADVAQMQHLDAFKADVDKYSPTAMANLGVARPTIAASTFDPLAQQTPMEEGLTPDAAVNALRQTLNQNKQQYNVPKKGADVKIAPVVSNIRKSNFEHFYEHPKYADLGFSPYANSDQFYNDNSTAGDDRTRMWGQFTGLLGTGFMGGYRSIGDLFTGNAMSPDLASATEMEDAMRIGSSTRGGATQFANNLLLNSAYTVGVITSVALEEVALLGLEAVTFGGATPLVAAKTATNVAKVGNAVANTFAVGRIGKMANYTRNAFKQMNNVDKAKDFFNAANSGKKFVGKIFFPETTAAIKALKSTQNGVQNMSNMAKGAKKFGGFYKDVRSLNYALAESKLESGMVYNSRVSENIRTQVAKNNGGNVTAEQMAEIEQNASRAAFSTLSMNAPLIFLSNQIVLGNAFGGFSKSFARMTNDNIKGIGRRIVRGSKVLGGDGKLARDVFEDVGSGIKGGLKRMKSLGVKGNAKAAFGASARFFSANFAEGIQEISQEAISHGTNHYYDAVFKDPLSGGIELQRASISSAVSSQFTAQGFETFMSGFLMGGVVSGPQKLFFQGIPSVYKFGLNEAGVGVGSKKQNEAWAEYKTNRDDLVAKVVLAYNETWNKQAEDPNSMFDPHKLNFLAQKEAAGEKAKSAYAGDQFGFIDATDFAKFQQIFTVLSTGGARAFESQLGDYLKLSDEDLATAFPSDKKDIKSGKLRERFQSMITQISKTEDVFNKTKDKFENPYDASQYTKGSREYQAEAIKQYSYEHVRYLYMFTKDGFDRAVERSNGIYQALASEPMFEKMAASDLTVLLDPDSVINELEILASEVKTLAFDKEVNKKVIAEKEEKIAKLKAVQKVLTDPKNLSDKGIYDRRKIGALKAVFKDYVKFLANSNDSFVDEEVINDVLKKMVDYKALKGRAKVYDKTIELLANPEKFDEVLQRQYKIHDAAFNNIEKDYKEVIENYLKTQEMNELLNQIANIEGYEVIPDPDQAKFFLATGDIRFLTRFYIAEIGEVTAQSMPALHEVIENLKATYAGIQADKADAAKAETESEVSQKNRNEVSDILKGMEGVDENLMPSRTKKYDELLTKVYEKYASNQANLGNVPLKFVEWLKTDDAENFRNAYNALRNIWVANDKLINPNKPLTEEEILNDNKFINWLLSTEGMENDMVNEILEKLNVDITDVTGQVENMGEEDAPFQGSSTLTLIKAGKTFSIVSEETVNAGEEGGSVTKYIIKDNTTKEDVDLEILEKFTDKFNLFDTIQEARELFVKMEEGFGGNESFVFEELTLKHGSLVYSVASEGKPSVEYVVLSKAKSINEGKSLALIPSDKMGLNYKERGAFIVSVPEGGFEGFYTLQDMQVGLKTLGPNVSRLNVSEPITPYPLQNFDSDNSYQEGQDRYNAILSVLTPEEASSLELIIMLDQNPNKDTGNYKYKQEESNPYIKTIRSKYQIGIKAGNPSVQKKIDDILAARKIPAAKNSNGIFAFINVDGFAFQDVNGKEINPANFTEEQMDNLFRTPEHLKGLQTPAELLAEAQHNFAANKVLVNTLDALMADVADGEKVTIPISELTNGISFDMQLGLTGWDNESTRALNDLEHKNVDNNGNYLIFKMYTLNGVRTQTAVTNLEGDKREALIEKVLADLTKQGLYDEQTGGELRNGTIDPKTGVKRNDAYKAIVLLPNGTYSLVNLKAKVLVKSELDSIFVSFITQAQEVIANKKEIFGDQKDNKANIDENAKATIALREFSAEMADNKFYISTIAGHDISMQVSAWGKIELQLSKGKERLATIRLDKATILNKDLSVDAKMKVLIDLFNGSVEAQEAGVELKAGNFRRSFSKDAPIETMLEDTETNVIYEVAHPGTITLSADSSSIQAAGDASTTTTGVITPSETFKDAEGNPIPKGPELIVESAPELSVTDSPLAVVKEEIKVLKAKLQEGKKGKEKRAVLTASDEYQALLKKRNDLHGAANKILASMSSEAVEDINVFMNWANDNLPQSISIQDIALLGNNLKAGGVRVGAFVIDLKAIAGGETVKGTLYTGAKSPFRYHEAFHSVFRMLLNDVEIKKYLSIARKEARAKLRAEGKNFNTELELFRRSADTYTNMSKARLEQEYYEEYLADEFEKFKTNPKNSNTSSEVKSLFTKILDWIKSVFSSTDVVLQDLFENINNGKYKNAEVVSNQFTSQFGITLEANALIPYEVIQEVTEVKDAQDKTVKKLREGSLYLDSDIANPMIASMAAMYLQRVSKNTDTTILRSEMLEGIMDDFYVLYDPTEDNNLNKSPKQIELLEQASLAIDEYSDIIKTQVYAYLNVIDSQVAEEEYNAEFFEDTVGLRGIDSWSTDASMIGGVNSTPKEIRAYIATTTIAETDFFGNTELTEGERLIVPVNISEVYNGLLKSVKNIENPRTMLQNMYFFGLQNAETGAVVSRLLADIGITTKSLLLNTALPLDLKNPQLLQAFTKAFENFRVDYLFTQRDNAGNVLWYSAAQRDDVNSQMDMWSQAWTQASKKLKSDATTRVKLEKLLEKFQAALKSETEYYSNAKLAADSKNYAEKIFEYAGVKLSPQFIQYSIVKNKKKLNMHHQALLNANAQEAAITSDDIGYMKELIQTQSDIFSEGETGMNSRLKKLAVQNAPFDESIGLSVFKNAEGNLVYAHQKPTYHLKQIQKLNDVAQLEILKEKYPYLKNNHLLNNAAFIQMSVENRQKILRVAGAAVGQINETEADINDNISGISSRSTYGNFSPQEFALSLINSYASLVNTKTGRVDFVEVTDESTGKKVKVALTPSLLRVLESSNTGDMAYMPVIQAVKFLKGNSGESVLTDETLNIFTTSIETEFNRIRREVNEETKTKRNVLGFNEETFDKETGDVILGRAYKLHNSSLLLNEDVKKQLEEIANRDDTSFKDALTEINLTVDQFKKQLNEILDAQFEAFSNELTALNIDTDISNSIKLGLDNKGLFAESSRLLNLSTDKTHNLKQIFFNDWVNTKSINEILLGDQAITLKNGVDAIKRAKAQNAATISAYSAVTAPKLGVMHTTDKILANVFEEPIGTSSLTGQDIDKADAILYYTLKGLRYSEFGFGTLTPMQAELITRLEAGEEITDEEIFGSNGFVANGAMVNSRKLVYADGRTFIKMSAFPLIPQLTSNRVVSEDGKVTWVAKENRVELHNLRMKLEKQEAESDVIAIAAPLTAYKMLKQDVTSLSEFDNESGFIQEATELSARNLGLQVANPSNKMEIVDPTQIKNIVTSEQNDSEFVAALGMTVGQIRKAYNLATSRRVELKYKNKRNLIFNFDSSMSELEISKKTGKLTPDLMAFLKYAVNGLKASQSSSQLLEFFSTKNGEQQFDLNNPITINNFESLFLGYLSKGTLSEKLPGHALALVSDFGNSVYRRVFSFDQNGIPERSEVIREKNWENKAGKNSHTSNSIVEHTDQDGNGDKSWKGITVPKEGVVILDRLRTNVKEFDSKGKETGEKHTEMLMPAHYAEVMKYIENTNEPIPAVIAKMFAIRIPSQDNHSTINAKMVDFLPAVYGSVGMFAQELVEVSGADFDIDKVYTQIKEWYMKDEKFVEYGKATNAKDAHADYLNYVQSKVNKKGSTYNEALMLYKEDKQEIREDNPAALIFADSMTDKEYSKWANTIIALEMLGLPISVKQYSEYKAKNGEPYEAPLNNELLDLKYALMGNDSVTNEIDGKPAISYTPASLDILYSLWAEFSDSSEESATRSNYLVERSREDNIDVDNILGKIKSFKANKGAAIGAIVSPNQALSLLTEYGITLKADGPAIMLNGIKFDTFKHLREQLGDGKLGDRKQDIISSLITMATDNAKERLVAKLGLNKEALALVGNLTALGVPIRTSLLLINNPEIQSIYEQAINKKEKMDPGVESLLKDKVAELNDKINNDNKDKEAKSIELVDVTDALLRKSLDNEISDVEQLSILVTFSEATRVKKFTSNMRSISDLTNGLGKDITTVNYKREQMDQLFAKEAIMDLAPIYKSDTWQSKYLEIFDQIYDDLLPATFLSASPQFTSIMADVMDNMDVNKQEFTSETESKIARDLLSYITIKAYQHNVGNGTTGSIANLNNNFIYPSDQNSVIDLIERLRETEVGKDNFFLDVFAVANSASEKSNNTGLNLVQSNTFRSLNGQQKIDLQTSFAKIYGTLETKDDALSIINYMMVKDGLQMAYGTLLDAISPFTMTAYLDHIATANEALRNASDEKMMSTFGLTMSEMKDEFINGYLASNINNSLITTLYQTDGAFSKKTKGVTVKSGVLTAVYEKNPTSKGKRYIRVKNTSTEGYDSYKTYARDDVGTSESQSVKGAYRMPAYKVNKKLKNSDGSKRFASTDGVTITINPVTNTQELFDYMEGKEGGVSSLQKALVLKELNKQGYSLAKVKSILSTNKLANTFLVLHEQDHINNKDKDVYWNKGRDLLTPDKVAIEVRATIKALEQISGQMLSDSLNKTTEEVGVYNEIETYGSNQQNGIGFMFGERPTYVEVRKSVKELHNDPISDNFQTQSFDVQEAQLEQDLARAEYIDIVDGTPSEGGTKVDVTLAETETVVATPKEFQEGDVAEDALRDASELAASLMQMDLEFDANAAELNPQLIIFWDEVIDQDSEKKAKFAKNGMRTYSLMLEFFNKESKKGMYPATADKTSEEVFMEEIKCIL